MYLLLQVCAPIPAFPAMLFHHPYVRHDHASIDCLAHVIDRQETDLHRRQCFHFNAGLAEGFNLGAAMDAAVADIGAELDGDARQCQRMTQGHQITGAFGAHDGGDASNAQHIAFFCIASEDDCQRCRLHPDGSAGDGNPVSFILGADIDHVGAAAGIEMGELLWHLAIGRVFDFCVGHGAAHVVVWWIFSYFLVTCNCASRGHDSAHWCAVGVPARGACRYHIIVKSKLSSNTAVASNAAPWRRSVVRVALGLSAMAALSMATPTLAQFSAKPALRFNLPTLGDTERETLSPSMERQLGEEIMRDIRRNIDYLDDDPILEYLNDFGNVLVDAWPGARGETGYDYTFFAVRDTELNAFALPGGFIAVHSALLLAAQTESELASVLSHEIGHVGQRHIARMLGQQRQDVLIPLAAIVLAALASRASGDAALGVFAAGQGLAMQRQLNFSRDAEREADRIGFQIMEDAGFETTGMVAFFGRMQAASRSYNNLTPSYLLTHPLTTERIADILARIHAMAYRQRTDSLDFHLVRARVRVLQDESAHGLANATDVFGEQLLRPNRREVAAAQYGLAFIALKRSDIAGAQTWFAAANATTYPAQGGAVFGMAGLAPNAILTGLALDIALANRSAVRPEPSMQVRTLQQAEAAHDQFPRSRGIARQYVEAMLAAGRAEDAALYLRDQVQLYRSEPKLYDLLAKTYAAQGKMALQHMALAESYALRGAQLSALRQLTLARKSSDASFYELSEIDAREREWQARRREEMKEARK